IKSLLIQGRPLDEKKTYNVATTSYLVTGGDNMVFFKNATEVVETDYFVRNAIIDYFKKVDTIVPKIDDRFIKME
ncbi:MAG: hypothetical protein HKN31_09760, partial [Pricia sp.]|nr:hypothetical protein [Pricia sp.]